VLAKDSAYPLQKIGQDSSVASDACREYVPALATGRARARLDSSSRCCRHAGKAHWISTACEYAIGHGWPTPRVVALTCGSIPADNVVPVRRHNLEKRSCDVAMCAVTCIVFLVHVAFVVVSVVNVS